MSINNYETRAYSKWIEGDRRSLALSDKNITHFDDARMQAAPKHFLSHVDDSCNPGQIGTNKKHGYVVSHYPPPPPPPPPAICSRELELKR